ncbi:MAG: hypothetical protein IJ876_04205 [Elusimicrobiaceae bacterium]|nr:hypothetical protein [Elusimicrobiaceae bacterium]
MRTYKVILSLGLVVAVAFGAYAAFMYVYTDHMFAPVVLMAKPDNAAPASVWTAPDTVRFIHRVNTPTRARAKDKTFDGFEVDVWQQNGQLLAAHDPAQALKNIPLAAIFAAVKEPAKKSWWLDLKQDLTPDTLQQILNTARDYQIPNENLLFETSEGPTARLIKNKNLGLLLTLPEGFETDGDEPQKRSELNARVLSLWKEYQPAAVAASFGKYAYLKAYFPNMPKAIYYSSTVRPSLKKPFMAAHMQQDPAVKIFMTDEYTYL